MSTSIKFSDSTISSLRFNICIGQNENVKSTRAKTFPPPAIQHLVKLDENAIHMQVKVGSKVSNLLSFAIARFEVFFRFHLNFEHTNTFFLEIRVPQNSISNWTTILNKQKLETFFERTYKMILCFFPRNFLILDFGNSFLFYYTLLHLN